jgi:hypothetical protein
VTRAAAISVGRNETSKSYLKSERYDEPQVKRHAMLLRTTSISYPSVPTSLAEYNSSQTVFFGSVVMDLGCSTVASIGFALSSESRDAIGISSRRRSFRHTASYLRSELGSKAVLLL